MRIAVTGANGFVGNSLCQALAQNGFEVLALTRPTSTPNKAASHPNIHWLEVDYGDSRSLISHLRDVDTLIHLIAKTHAEDRLDELAQYRAINVELTRRIARSATQAGIKQFIYLSSIKVNGETTCDTPFSRDSIPAPSTAYGISKWEAEQALAEIHQQSGMNTTVIRCPLIYSPDALGNIQALRKAVSKGIPLPLGCIHNKRDVIDLELVIQHLIKLCKNDTHTSNYNYQVLLVSNGKALSTSQLAQKIGQDIGIPARILPFPIIGLKLLFACIGKSQAFAKLCDNLELVSDLPVVAPNKQSATD